MNNQALIEELQREAGGSFLTVIKALRIVSKLHGGATTLNKQEVIHTIRELSRKK